MHAIILTIRPSHPLLATSPVLSRSTSTGGIYGGEQGREEEPGVEDPGAVQGPLALPCAVDAFLDVLWHMDHDVHDDDDGEVAAAPSSPICGLQRAGSGNGKVRPAGYRVLSPAKSTSPSFFFSPTAAGGRSSSRLRQHRLAGRGSA
ncbi:hypothetical protein TRIUR3_04368 [Triticum urartu]|uniref:Uncharacterized protein n=1 Tax=Triticum urartu TaxID=4572 RepID=M8A5Z2_TRIUA|nr:hypothetical protein TRIUR3_04368 [Triticum urartu]